MSEINLNSPQTTRHELRSWFIPPFLVGLGLRGAGLRSQILTGDELHSVHGALEMSFGEILRTWTFGGADYCVPLTALYRLLMDQGFVLSEISFRIPSLAAGLAAILLLPGLASPRIGRRAAIALAWLLAISPMLVFYSRIVRSYLPAVLAAGVAVLLFDRWLRQRRPGAAVGYVLSGAAAVYLHLGAAPLVLAPLLFGAVQTAMRPKRLEGWLSLLWPALGIALTIAACLFPGHESLLELFEGKRDGRLPSILTWLEVLRLQLGTKHWIIAALAFALFLRGVAILWGTQRDFLVYLATLVAAQAIGLMILTPDRLQERAILNRYVLVTLPLLLIPMASGLAAPLRQGLPGSSRLGRLPVSSSLAVSAVALLAVFASGPLAPTSRYWRSSFTHSLSSVDFLGEGNWVPADVTPRFYQSLAGSERDAALIEYPWQNLSSHAFDAYQRTHGLAVIVSSVIDRTGERRIALRNRAEPTVAGFLASRARYLVVHKNLRAEAASVVSSDIHHRYWLRAGKELWEPLRRAAKLTSTLLEQSWGAPAYEDNAIRVWDLELVRERAREPGRRMEGA